MCFHFRYYQFNLSHTEPVTNLVPGEKTKYQIMLVPGTNVFVGVVNASYETGTAFCPCSTSDRLCLNCNRMEQTECECPCECPFEVSDDIHTAQPEVLDSIPPGCQAPSEQPLSYEALAQGDEIEMQSCLTVSCDIYTTQFDCLGVTGCEWCQVDVDGESLLNTPFCTSLLTCFNGVLGASDPYGEIVMGTTLVDPSIFSPPYSAGLGSFAGAIMILCLIIAVALYCYRNTVDQTIVNEHLYADSLQDNCGMPLSRFDYDDLSPSDDCEMNNIRQNLLLHQANPATLPSLSSPYRVVSSYRRVNGGESDLGYSTMTPQEESEHLFLTSTHDSLHPLHHNSTSDLASINASLCSFSAHNDRGYNGGGGGSGGGGSCYQQVRLAPPTVSSNANQLPHLHHSRTVGGGGVGGSSKVNSPISLYADIHTTPTAMAAVAAAAAATSSSSSPTKSGTLPASATTIDMLQQHSNTASMLMTNNAKNNKISAAPTSSSSPQKIILKPVQFTVHEQFEIS